MSSHEKGVKGGERPEGSRGAGLASEPHAEGCCRRSASTHAGTQSRTLPGTHASTHAQARSHARCQVRTPARMLRHVGTHVARCARWRTRRRARPRTRASAPSAQGPGSRALLQPSTHARPAAPSRHQAAPKAASVPTEAGAGGNPTPRPAKTQPAKT